jgi:starch-binding outer membrane protein, SusD/RagB family
VSPAVKKQLTGEAKFMRSFWYFYLVNIYGSVPLVTTTDYRINSTAPRASKEKLYEQIINDLVDAQAILSSNYVDASDTVITVDRIRPTKWAAMALLARVYLYNKEWRNAEIQSTNVISNSTMFDLVGDLNQVFLMNSPEAILQLQPATPGYNTNEGAALILTSTPTTVSLSREFLNSFESGDSRKAKWIDSISANGSVFYFPFKYKIRIGDQISEYSMVLRLAEQYLIRAEARAQQGNILGAQEDLNIIRSRAGLPNTTASSQSDLIAAVQHERRAELFTEWGHRWFDLKRTNTVDNVMSVITPTKGGDAWKSYQQYYPIPITDILANKSLTQTDGY